MNAECIVCGRPTPDGYTCVPCGVHAPRRKLLEIIDLTPPARDVVYGLARRGDGAVTGRPGSREPGNLDAMEQLDRAQLLLTTLARDIAETRGIEIPNGDD